MTKESEISAIGVEEGVGLGIKDPIPPNRIPIVL